MPTSWKKIFSDVIDREVEKVVENVKLSAKASALIDVVEGYVVYNRTNFADINKLIYGLVSNLKDKNYIRSLQTIDSTSSYSAEVVILPKIWGPRPKAHLLHLHSVGNKHIPTWYISQITTKTIQDFNRMILGNSSTVEDITKYFCKEL